ncbi:MAG: hypothetical protein ACOCWJ_01120, partial [Verrucomicrobiota bacterium]
PSSDDPQPPPEDGSSFRERDEWSTHTTREIDYAIFAGWRPPENLGGSDYAFWKMSPDEWPDSPSDFEPVEILRTTDGDPDDALAADHSWAGPRHPNPDNGDSNPYLPLRTNHGRTIYPEPVGANHVKLDGSARWNQGDDYHVRIWRDVGGDRAYTHEAEAFLYW